MSSCAVLALWFALLELALRIIEQPEPPRPEKSGEVAYYKLSQRRIRYPGRISYSVGLDTTVSVGERAAEECHRFLKRLEVE